MEESNQSLTNSQILNQTVLQYYSHLDQQNSGESNRYFELLVSKLKPVASAIIRKRVQDKYLLQKDEELLNQLWVAIFESAIRPSLRWNLEKGASFQTWAISILNNKIFDAFRKHQMEKKRGVVSLFINKEDQSGHDLPDPKPAGIELMISNERNENVKAAIKKLPLKYREICWLKLIDKMKSREISLQTGKTESYICKALKKSDLLLKDLLGNSWDPQE